MQIKKIQAFTLLEILLAAIIFMLSVAGIFVTLNAVRTPVINKENQLAATVYEKQVLEALYSQVNAKTYYSGCASQNPCPQFDLTLGNHTVLLTAGSCNISGQAPVAGLPPCLPTTPMAGSTKSLATLNVDGSGNPHLIYAVICADGNGSAGNVCNGGPDIVRRVDISITWASVP